MTPRPEILPPGCTLDDAAWERIAAFVAALLEENQHLNLTGAKSDEELWRTHVADSLALLPHLVPLTPGAALDIGTGGGLPGLVLACALPATTWTLLDSTHKKIDAVGRIAARIGLANVRAVWGRGELLAKAELASRFDVVTARAVAELSELVMLASKLLRPGGVAWFYKTTTALEREFPPTGAAAHKAGMRWIATHDYTLPGEHPGRVLVRYDRIAAPG